MNTVKTLKLAETQLHRMNCKVGLIQEKIDSLLKDLLLETRLATELDTVLDMANTCFEADASPTVFLDRLDVLLEIEFKRMP